MRTNKINISEINKSFYKKNGYLLIENFIDKKYAKNKRFCS